MQYLAAPTMESKILEMLSRTRLASVDSGPQVGGNHLTQHLTPGLLLIPLYKTNRTKQNAAAIFP